MIGRARAVGAGTPSAPAALVKALAPWLLGALPVLAHAGDAFSDRVMRAKAVEETKAGQAYQERMWPTVQPFVAALMQRCIPEDPKADLTSFVWVATLSASAQLIDIAVQPITEVSTCFAAGMARAPFPKPPPELAALGMPLTLNMRLHPMD